MQAFYRSLLNCSASGKKRGGDHHVRKALMPIGFYGLIPPLVLSKSVLLLLLNLLNCKHRKRVGDMAA